jgi:uncharacterized protein (TIGR00255 family)
MMKSMTGYTYSEKRHHGISARTEVRTYNSRHLDISLRIPHAYLALEEKIKGVISQWLSRGRVEISIHIRHETEQDYGLELDLSKAEAYQKAMLTLGEMFDTATGFSMDFLVGSGGVAKLTEPERDMDSVWPPVNDGLLSALSDLDAMRTREGDHIARDIAQRLDDIQTCLGRVRDAATDLTTLYQDRLKERISVLTKGLVEIDPARIAQEAAFLADKSDISEEIVRAESHLKQFRDIMTGGEPGGRKLNFLLQEFSREFNTMGSKSGNTEISHTIVYVKSELEKIREQVQNVE